VFRSKPPLKIKVPKIESPPQNIADQTIKLPPQLRKLKLHESKPTDPLSPLRRYAGRLHAVISNATSGSPTSRQSRRTSMASMCIARARDLERENQNNTFSPVQDDYLELDRNEPNGDEMLNRTNRNKSPVNLQRLLMIPVVDHRVNRRSMSFLAISPAKNGGDDTGYRADDSVYFTPSVHRENEMEIHSIMKVH